jgi:hypothetical protein
LIPSTIKRKKGEREREREIEGRKEGRKEGKEGGREEGPGKEVSWNRSLTHQKSSDNERTE